MSRRSRLAFTMLELLVVIAIMAILASLILVGASTIMGNAEKKKTETIIQTVKTGIELAIANKGSAISPTEHPFAGSNADARPGGRFKFIRASGNSLWSTGSAVATNGTALKGVPNPQFLSLGAQSSYLLMASDRYQDERIVLLHGAKREDIGVLQSLRKVVTKYRLLPMPPKKANGSQATVLTRTGGNPTSYQGDTNTEFPDTLIPSLPQINDVKYGLLSDTKPALDYLFGNSSAQAELASLKALYNADPTLPVEVNKFTIGVEPCSIGMVNEPLVYTNATSGADAFRNQEPHWKPGYIPVSSGSGPTVTLDSISGTKWVRYRLAGLAVYDAWGNELMTVTGANNSYRVISAGADGALAVDPDKDRQINTTTIALDGNLKLTIDPRDKDGERDNLQ